MSYMPSAAFVAQALHAVGAEADWEELPGEEQQTYMVLAKVAIGAILSWQKQHRPDGSDRYWCELMTTEVREGLSNQEGYSIFDKSVGSHTPLGVIHDALLAQQVVDDLNQQDAKTQMPKPPAPP